MIIILEGPDGSGKTTLANQLVLKYGLKYHHEGPPPLNPASATLYYTTKLLMLSDSDVVIDRFAMGERVYGTIFRKNDRLGDRGWQEFRTLAERLKVVQILCMPPYFTCHAAWSSGRNEMLPDADTLHRVYDMFWTFAEDDQYVYDWTSPNAFEELCEVIAKWSSNTTR